MVEDTTVTIFEGGLRLEVCGHVVSLLSGSCSPNSPVVVVAGFIRVVECRHMDKCSYPRSSLIQQHHAADSIAASCHAHSSDIPLLMSFLTCCSDTIVSTVSLPFS